MDAPDRIPISEARADLSGLVATVRHGRRIVVLTRREKPQVGVVPIELADAARAIGIDRAIEILNAHADQTNT